MKWSEQMRVLLSEDEHYNQLVYDANENVLYLNNKKLIADLKPNILENGGDSVLCLFYDDAIEIMKKYPFFTDIKFLLNCIFRTDFYFIKAKEIYYYEYYIVIQSGNSTSALVIYTAPRQ